ncbi:hypothetical protein [Candidatus Magnetaquicoccus inordinatus]|uniref:hypothetical protein n=1 Tax=Candidatus Magnetaquicoccus inordinatus TaxID=2496818 RepID=UPI00102B79D0|nr:hypothetical protein [Candidatus Magnetaquicoccus inordinatus]
MMETISVEDQQILDSMKKAVANALERKRRLGQYAVIWKDGRSAILGGKELSMEPVPSSSIDTANPPTP